VCERVCICEILCASSSLIHFTPLRVRAVGVFERESVRVWVCVRESECA